MPETAFIYGLLDPRNGELRYVGKTVSIEARLKRHRSCRSLSPKSKWVRELFSNGLAPKVIVLSEVPIREWKKRERETIERYRRLGCPLLNAIAGGGGSDKTIPKENTSPKARKESKVAPLSPKDIRRVFFERDKSIAAWARERGFDAWQVRAVIARNPEVVYQDIRGALAEYIGCDVSQIGREPSREIQEQAA